MKISTLIQQLAVVIDQHGDLDVLLGDGHITLDPWCQALPIPLTLDEEGVS